MKRYSAYIVAGLLVLGLGTQVQALVSSINGEQIQLRRFNDYNTSTLVVTPVPPPPGPASPVTYGVAGLGDVIINEGPFGPGGFANQHRVRFSNTAGATDYRLAGPVPPPAAMSPDAFDISFDVTMSVGSTAPRKEAGFIADTFVGGEARFIITSDGEVVAFDGPFPFFSFGASGSGAYVPGNRARLRLIYTPDNDPTPTVGDASTMQYFYDNNVADAVPAVASPVLEFSNLENGMIANSDIGLYVQNQPNDSNSNDFSNVAFRSIQVNVPEPASGALLMVSLLGLAARGRR